MGEPWPLFNLYTDLNAVLAGECTDFMVYAAVDLCIAKSVRYDDGSYHRKLTKQGEYLMNLLREDYEKWNERCEQ